MCGSTSHPAGISTSQIHGSSLSVLERYRNSRAWNVNGNVLVASTLAVVLTALTLEIIQPLVGGMLSTLLLSAILDAVYNVAIFAGLHAWTKTYRQRFLRDLGLLQAHRFFLSPLFYLIAVPGQALLLMAGFSTATSLLAYLLALLVTRGVHTAYGLRTGLFDS